MKKLLSIFSVLMIIFTFSLPAFATDTTDTADTIDTSNWITHEIPELGISLALPQGTKVYTRDCLSDENLKNDPNFERVTKYFSLDSRYCLAINEDENLSLNIRISPKGPRIYPLSSTKTLPAPVLNSILNGLNSKCSGDDFFSTISFDSDMYMIYPPAYKSHYVYYLYGSVINNIFYGFDFRMEADSGVDKPTEIYNAILSTVDFSNVPTDIYSSLPVLLVLLLAAVFLIYRFVKSRKQLTNSH